MDEEVQKGTPSEGDVSASETPPQPFTPEQDARITEILQQVAENSMLQGVEQGKRDMQGKKDAELARIQRRYQAQDYAYGNLEAQDLDPEAKQALQNARVQGQLQYYQMAEVEQAQRNQRESFGKSFHDGMVQAITAMGLDPNSKEIDWAADIGPDYLEKQKRILSSVAKMQENKNKDLESRIEQRIKDETAQIRKDMGLDSVDTSEATSSGVGDDKFIKDFSEGKVVMTKENLSRYNKITT